MFNIKSCCLLAILLIASLGLHLKAQTGGPNGEGEWGQVIQMPLVPVAAANLPNGKVLVWSAYDRFAFGGNRGRTYTAIFDPATNQSEELLVTSTQHDMFCPGTSNLVDGRILVSGGSSNDKTTIYDPFTNSWLSSGVLNIPRAYHSTVVLSDGRVFTIGGSWSGGIGGKHGEIWEDGLWSQLNGVPVAAITDGGPETNYNDFHASLWPAPNGKVFHAGPSPKMHWINTEGEGSYIYAGNRDDDEFAVNAIYVMYDVGKLLKAGGSTAYDGGTLATANTYTIDINQDQVQVKKVQSLQYTRSKTNGVVLPTGEVLAIGGVSTSQSFVDIDSRLTPELWNPETEQWRALAPMQVPRNYHSVALLLGDGRVLAGGGGLCGGCPTNHPDIEIFSPSYLFNPDGTPAIRPEILTAPQVADPNSVINVSANETISTWAMVRFNSVTHSTNNEQRRFEVEATDLGNNEYEISVPDNKIAIPGYYMLFALNANGTPSVAHTIKVLVPPRCPDLPNNPIVGGACDDGDDCTSNDVVLSDCTCKGTDKPDTDQDGVCDEFDLDIDNDGILNIDESCVFTSFAQARNLPPGEYNFNFGQENFKAYVDHDGWVLWLQYHHLGGSNPDLNVIPAGNNLPTYDPSGLGTDNSGDSTKWGHGSQAFAASIPDTNLKLRFQASTEAHSRVVHFETEMLGGFLADGSSFDGLQSNFTPIEGHTARIPGNANGFFINQGDFALTNLPFYRIGADHWGIRALGGLWEVDSWSNDGSYHTIHRVWVKSTDGGSNEVCLDMDNDSINNFLDTDSDNDGCFDALEGNGGFTVNNVDANGRLTGGVDANGVPNIANGGQEIGSSLNANLQPDDCILSGLQFSLRLFLEGPYDASSGLMNDNLRSSGLISNTDPYGLGANIAPGLLGQEGADALVEWIHLELRDKDDPSTLIAAQALLLQRDGDVMMPDGNTVIGFGNVPVDSYYVVVGQQNHLCLSTDGPVDFGSNPFIDFSNPATPVLGGSDGGSIKNNTRVLISGDASGDGTVNALDKNSFWRVENGGTYQYGLTKADFNLDGTVNAVDKNVLWRANNSRGEILP